MKFFGCLRLLLEICLLPSICININYIHAINMYLQGERSAGYIWIPVLHDQLHLRTISYEYSLGSRRAYKTEDVYY